MCDDLISRSALKKAIKTECNPYGKPTIDFESGKRVLELIDNAPTVDVIPNKEGYEMYNKGYMSGYERGKGERPQGHWYKTGQSFVNPSKFRNYCCSNCQWELDEHIRTEPNFCPNCGADMKGDINNE